MTNLLEQPPHLRLNLELCEKLYDIYLSNTSDLFALPAFNKRYWGRLEGIIGSVSQTFDEVELFPTIGESAAAYFVKIGTQHPFRDGNKRMSVYFTDIFLTLNGITLKMGWREMYELAKFIVDKKESGEKPERLQFFVQYVFSQNL